VVIAIESPIRPGRLGPFLGRFSEWALPSGPAPGMILRMDAIPLTAEDRAILALESATIAGHVCKVAELGAGAPSVGELRELVAERIHEAPALMTKLGGTAAAPAWVPDDDFDVTNHVVAAPVEAPLQRAEVAGAVATLFEQRLERSRPLWRIDLASLEDGGALLVWRTHHALADGTAAMRYARTLLWDRAVSGDAPRGSSHADDDERRRAHLAGFLHREFARSRDASPFDGRIGTRRTIAFAQAPLRALHDAAKSLGGATVNDAVLTCVAGGLRRWISEHHGALGTVRVKVPVSLHHEGDDASNRDSFFAVALPLNEPDPVARLAAVHAATAVRKADHDAEEMDALLRDLSRVSPQLEQFCSRLTRSPRRFAVNVSNVPGPRAPVSVLGAPVEALHAIAEIGEHHALRVAVVSLADTLHFGFCADPAIVDDLDAMVAGVEGDAAALIST
jgi:diacylglycerol O-acyltransferase